MPELATALYRDLKRRFPSFYDDSGAIGRRYRRMDEAGTPFGITVDGETTSGGTVTVRHRDSMQQERVRWIRWGTTSRSGSLMSSRATSLSSRGNPCHPGLQALPLQTLGVSG